MFSPTTFAGLRAMPNTMIQSAFSTTQITSTTTATVTATATETVTETIRSTFSDVAVSSASTTYNAIPNTHFPVASLVHHMVGNLASPLHSAAFTAVSIPADYEDYAPIIGWVLGSALLGTAGYLFLQYRSASSIAKTRALPIPADQDARSWKAKTRLTSFLLLKCAQSNTELKENAKVLQHGLDREVKYREKVEQKLAESKKNTPREKPVVERAVEAAFKGYEHQLQSTPIPPPPSFERRVSFAPTPSTPIPRSSQALETVVSSVLNNKKFQHGVQRATHSQSPTTTKRKSEELDEDEVVESIETPLTPKGKEKRKVELVAEEVEQIEDTHDRVGTQELDECDGMIGVTTPEANKMDWGLPRETAKLDLDNVPDLAPRKDAGPPAKRARKNSDATDEIVTATTTARYRRSRSPSKATQITASPSRRSKRNTRFQENMNEREMAKRSMSLEKRYGE